MNKMTLSFVSGLTRRDLEHGLAEYRQAMLSCTVSEHIAMTSVPDMSYSQFATWVAIHIHMSRQRTDPRDKLPRRRDDD